MNYWQVDQRHYVNTKVNFNDYTSNGKNVKKNWTYDSMHQNLPRRVERPSLKKL